MARRWLGLGLVILALLTGCVRRTEGRADLYVAAAASLAPVTEALAAAYEQRCPAVRVVWTLAGSQQLAAQIESGAPVDLFMSADCFHAVRLHRQHLLESPTCLVRNYLALAATARNQQVVTLDDVAKPGVRLVLCGPDVPVGRYTEQALTALGRAGRDELVAAIRANTVSREASVQGVVSKLELGEADAGFVYRTDVLRAGLRNVPLPAGAARPADYLMGVVRRSRRRGPARGFAEFLKGPQARRILEAAGFAVPGAEAQ